MIGAESRSYTRRSRGEAALVAHKRSNAFSVEEANLGSLAPAGKYAHLLVLDREHLTISAE